MARTISIATLLAVSLIGVCALHAASSALANEGIAAVNNSTATNVPHLTVQEFSAQSRRILRRVPHRVRIYGNRIGPNAVRVCNAHYVQEYRPSGTVIVPRMSCYWRG